MSHYSTQQRCEERNNVDSYVLTEFWDREPTFMRVQLSYLLKCKFTSISIAEYYLIIFGYPRYTNTLLVVLNNRIYIRGENIADRMAGVTSSSGPSRDVSSNRLTEALSQQRPKTVSDHIHSIPGKPRPYGEDIHLDTIRVSMQNIINRCCSNEFTVEGCKFCR